MSKATGGRCFGQDLMRGEGKDGADYLGNRGGRMFDVMADTQAALFDMPAADKRPSLADRFVIPPFSVLDTRQGYWQDRKRAWIATGIKGEEGRGDCLPGGGGGPETKTAWLRQGKSNSQIYTESPSLDSAPGKVVGCSTDAYRKTGEETSAAAASGTSIFDPVLCEVVYRWFLPDGGAVLDPFGGESTKGIVAGLLGFDYTAVELRPEQVAANERQAQAIGVTPRWVQGDSSELDKLLPAGALYDLVFTSPPYYDLEIYSESEKDGSAFETYEKFMAWYAAIFGQAVARMRDNRFLVVKIGEIRDKKTGIYRNFVGDNITCFRSLGLHYYNELILVTAVGSLPVRVGKQMSVSRKIGKTHQNVLVFFKGDARRIRDEFPNFSS